MSEGQFHAVSLNVVAGKYTGKDHRFDIGYATALTTEIAILSDNITAFMLKVTTRIAPGENP
jgi:hypothetical protein